MLKIWISDMDGLRTEEKDKP